MKKIIFLLIYLFSCELVLAEDTGIPAEITANFSSPKILGSSRLELYGSNIYDIELWIEDLENSENYQSKFAIRIKYNRSFTKQELVTRAIEEIVRIHQIGKIRSSRYQLELNKVLNGVEEGDVRTSFFSNEEGLKLYLNSNLVGHIKDKVLSKYFTDIWLSEDTKFKKVREQLLKSK